MKVYNEPAVRYISEQNFNFRTMKPGDVGHDLFANLGTTKVTWLDKLIRRFDRNIICIIWPFTNKAIGSGIFLSMQQGVWAKVEARSSTGRKQMSVDGGVIDSGYRGEMFAVLSNKGLLPRVIRHGERYAQVIFHHAVRPTLHRLVVFESQDITDRGMTGFGSSGQ